MRIGGTERSDFGRPRVRHNNRLRSRAREPATDECHRSSLPHRAPIVGVRHPASHGAGRNVTVAGRARSAVIHPLAERRRRPNDVHGRSVAPHTRRSRTRKLEIIPAIFGYPRRTFGTRPAVPEPGSMVMRVRMPVAGRQAPSRRRQCGGVGGAILLLAVAAQPKLHGWGSPRRWRSLERPRPGSPSRWTRGAWHPDLWGLRRLACLVEAPMSFAPRRGPTTEG